MKVKDLIAQLEELPSDAEVFLSPVLVDQDYYADLETIKYVAKPRKGTPVGVYLE